jgi:hypothetical protein
LLIGAGQVAPLPQRFRVGIHLQPPPFQHGDAALQPLESIGLQGGTGGSQLHAITAA